MDHVTLYNREGCPVAWLGDNEDYTSIVLFDGTPVAWMADNTV